MKQCVRTFTRTKKRKLLLNAENVKYKKVHNNVKCGVSIKQNKQKNKKIE